MNKAFVREPDINEEFCPRCGSIGQAVGRGTIRNYVSQEAAVSLSEPANFCPKPTCEVVYFDVFERYVLTDALIKPAYPKDPQAPMCACFGVTERDIDADISEGGKSRTRSVVDRSKSPAAHCEQLAANGRSCVPEVQRYFIRRLNSAGK